ncbi:hypothetical protein B0J18DRAFT_438564 [Chaetomium sp. MPI-SDFR-AT-0129]|nr:hypothetical protein B0J18DRAFT_438564 [Chaetomium sp. MPI-SDFR-AT-0129]
MGYCGGCLWRVGWFSLSAARRGRCTHAACFAVAWSLEIPLCFIAPCVQYIVIVIRIAIVMGFCFGLFSNGGLHLPALITIQWESSLGAVLFICGAIMQHPEVTLAEWLTRCPEVTFLNYFGWRCGCGFGLFCEYWCRLSSSQHHQLVWLEGFCTRGKIRRALRRFSEQPERARRG